MGDFSDFERGQIVGERLAGGSVPKTVTLLEARRVAVSVVIRAYEDNIGEEEEWAKNQF
jgi:hypothetical protein